MSKAMNDGNSKQNENEDDDESLLDVDAGIQSKSPLPSASHDENFKPGTPVDTSNLFQFDFGNL